MGGIWRHPAVSWGFSFVTYLGQDWIRRPWLNCFEGLKFTMRMQRFLDNQIYDHKFNLCMIVQIRSNMLSLWRKKKKYQKTWSTTKCKPLPLSIITKRIGMKNRYECIQFLSILDLWLLRNQSQKETERFSLGNFLGIHLWICLVFSRVLD